MKFKQYTGMQKRRALYGYLFISPFIFGFLVFMIQPLLQSLWMSFSDVIVSPKGFEINFFGIANYSNYGIQFLCSYDFKSKI